MVGVVVDPLDVKFTKAAVAVASSHVRSVVRTFTVAW